MVGRDRRAGELQTPVWNWEQKESNMLGLVGPATEEVQSMEEQDTWWCNFGVNPYCLLYPLRKDLLHACDE